MTENESDQCGWMIIRSGNGGRALLNGVRCQRKKEWVQIVPANPQKHMEEHQRGLCLSHKEDLSTIRKAEENSLKESVKGIEVPKEVLQKILK